MKAVDVFKDKVDGVALISIGDVSVSWDSVLGNFVITEKAKCYTFVTSLPGDVELETLVSKMVQLSSREQPEDDVKSTRLALLECRVDSAEKRLNIIEERVMISKVNTEAMPVNCKGCFFLTPDEGRDSDLFCSLLGRWKSPVEGFSGQEEYLNALSKLCPLDQSDSIVSD